MYLQGSSNDIISAFYSRNLTNQKGVGQYIQIAKIKKYYQPRILHLAKKSFKNEGEIKTFPDKQKLREFIITRTAL